MNHTTVRIIALALVLLAGLSYGAVPARAAATTDAIAIPQLLNYQGRLTDGAGNPVNGSRDLTFKLYAESTGGTAVWTESQTGVLVLNGLFNVALGSVTPITAIPEGPSCYLEVAVAGEVLAPRVRIVSAGYAYNAARAEDANKLGGVPASGYVQGVTATSPLASTGGQTPNLTLNTTMGGDLTGSYPSPTLVNTGVAAGTYGADTLVPRITVDARGRITSASNVALGSPASSPNGNIFRHAYNTTLYSVPGGKRFLLYTMSVFNGQLLVNGSSMFISNAGCSFPFDPPLEFPAGTVFSTNYYATIYGYEWTP